MTPLLVVYAIAAGVAIFLILFAMAGETLRWRSVRRWWFTAALAAVLLVWLGTAAAR
jgi:hypothetical protein